MRHLPRFAFLLALTPFLCTCGDRLTDKTPEPDPSSTAEPPAPVVIVSNSPGRVREYRPGETAGPYSPFTPSVAYVNGDGLTVEIKFEATDSTYVVPINADRELTEVRLRHRAFTHHTYHLRPGDTLNARFAGGRMLTEHVGPNQPYPNVSAALSAQLNHAYGAATKLRFPFHFVALPADPSDIPNTMEVFREEQEAFVIGEAIQAYALLDTLHLHGPLAAKTYAHWLNILDHRYGDLADALATRTGEAVDRYREKIRPYQLHYAEMVRQAVYERGKRYPAIRHPNGSRPDFARIADDLYAEDTDTIFQRRMIEYTLGELIATLPSAEHEPHLGHYRSAYGGTPFLRRLVAENRLNYATTTGELTLINVAGEQLTLREIMARTPDHLFYLDFWASWCAPCRRAFPASRVMHDELKRQPVTMLYLSIDLGEEDWRKGTRDADLPTESSYRLAYPKTSKWLERYAVTTIPRYMVLDADGTVLHARAPGPGAAARSVLTALLDSR